MLKVIPQQHSADIEAVPTCEYKAEYEMFLYQRSNANIPFLLAVVLKTIGSKPDPTLRHLIRKPPQSTTCGFSQASMPSET